MLGNDLVVPACIAAAALWLSTLGVTQMCPEVASWCCRQGPWLEH